MYFVICGGLPDHPHNTHHHKENKTVQATDKQPVVLVLKCHGNIIKAAH